MAGFQLNGRCARVVPVPALLRLKAFHKLFQAGAEPVLLRLLFLINKLFQAGAEPVLLRLLFRIQIQVVHVLPLPLDQAEQELLMRPLQRLCLNLLSHFHLTS
jgi:hypothetical protein